MKRLSLLTALLLLLSCIGARAHDFEVGGIYYNITSSAAPLTVAVTYQGSNYSSYKNEYSGAVTIPKSVTYNGNTYSVTSIGMYAFRHCTDLTSVTIPNGVTSIGRQAFEGCAVLTSITVPNSVTSIGWNAFSSTAWDKNQPNGLVYAGKVAYGYHGTMPANTSIVLKEGTVSISDYAFEYCSGLTSITIPNSVTNIGDRAFSGCSGLTSVTIPNSVTSIGSFAFSGCSGLTSVTFHCKEIGSWFKGMTSIKEVVIGNEVTSIGGSAFRDCSGLTSVTIPNSVTSIGSMAFNGTGITSITIPNSVTSIGDGAFSNCSSVTFHCKEIGSWFKNETSIKEVVIGEEVTKIGESAFYGCSRLTSVTIPNSVTSIGSKAFYNCSRLTSITIPNSVTNIGYDAFDGCSGLTSVTFHCKEIGSWFRVQASIKEIVIGEEVTSIGSEAFYGCSGLTSVTIPNSVSSIGERSFEKCLGLTSVTIPNSVTSIGKYAFQSCSRLTSVTIPNSVTSIGDGAFSSCSGLTSVTFHCKKIGTWFKGRTSIKEIVIGEEVTSIAGGAFSGCSGLTSVTIPNSVTSIGDETFSGCTGLTSVIIPNSVTGIGGGVFKECSSLTSFTIPNSVTSIGGSAFSGCSGLTSITIPNSVTSIGYGAFKECTGLASVTIPSSVTNIGESAFSGCSGLTSVTIPNSVTSIGSKAFDGCSSLTVTFHCKEIGSWFSKNTSIKGVVIGNDVTSIGQYAFSGCTGLTSVTMGSGVTTIGSSAFNDCTGLKKVIVKDLAAWCSISFANKAANPLAFARHLYSNKSAEINNLVIPDGVTSIHKYAFCGCLGLNFISIPESVTSIGSQAFYGCLPFSIPKGTWSRLKDLQFENGHIYEVEGDMVWTDIIVGGLNTYSTYYDCDGDGEMEYLSYKKNAETNIYDYGFFGRDGNIKEVKYTDESYNKLREVTPKNGSGELLYYNSGSSYASIDGVGRGRLLADIDNDGRKDLVGDYSYGNDSFTIYYQQADGTFKAVEQSATLDAAAIANEEAKKHVNKGIASFAVGMMVGGGSGASTFDYLTGLDMNEDGILDMMDTYKGGVLYSYDDNKFFANSKKGVLYPCDLNGDGDMDYICNDGQGVILMTRTSGNSFNEKTLFSNSNVKKILYRDFDHDGDIDIMAYINDTGTTYFVFFRNDGDLSFKRRERNFAVNYDLLEVKDVDADGLYEMLVYDDTNKVTKLLRIGSDLSVVDDAIEMSDREVRYDYTDLPVTVGDFDNDGKVDYRYATVGKSSGTQKSTKYGVFSQSVNTTPKKMEAPTAILNAEAGRLRISWKQGEDKETSACDLTYELRIGTQPASGDVLFGASLADGRRRILDDGNMGRSLSTLFNARSLKPGKYYISVQAIDAGGRGGAWSDDFVYEHQLAAPMIVSNYTQHMSTADTIRLSVKAPVDGAEYKWTVSEGRQIENDGTDTRFVFEHDGEHTVNLAMTCDGRTINAEPLTLDVDPVKPYEYVYGVNYAGGYVDLNQDGYPEYLGYANDGKGIMEKVLLSYATDIPTNGRYYLDYNLDGYPDVIVRNNVYINLGEQDNDFDMFNQTFRYYEDDYYGYTPLTYIKGSGWFDANNDGYLDNSQSYNDGTNIVWRTYEEKINNHFGVWDHRQLLYDVNRDGMMDWVVCGKKRGSSDTKFYVMYKDSTANMNYISPQLMWENVGNDWKIEDLNNDGYADIVSYSGNTLTVVKGSAALPYTETVTYDLHGDIKSIRDYNNDGYMDILLYYSQDSYSHYVLAEFGPDFSMKLVELDNEPHEDYFMVQKDGGYPDGNLSHIQNQSPSAPASVAAKQTKDGMLITWSDAEDDHTPAMQMRYNVSVKRKGKKGDNSFVISPMNGLKDEATICGTVIYKKSTQMIVPASVLTAGETYEIQVQAIDLWNQHSPMTKAVEFTMTSNGYIDVAEQVATDKETTVKFVGAKASKYSLNAGDGATIISNNGNGEYIVKWATDGVKDITMTVGNSSVKSSITVVKPVDLAFSVPAKVFAGVPLTISVSDEMAKEAKNTGLRSSNKNVKIDYVTGSKTASVTFPATGKYTLEAYCTDEVRGGSCTKTVNVNAMMPTAEIEQVDVDGATGFYSINWDASALPSGISKVVVMKEGSSLSSFSEIATVDAGEGAYVDNSSNPRVMASRYSIRLLAGNGQESEVSVPHRPLHVMIAKAAKGYNLIWDCYEGLEVGSYSIMRGSTPENMQEIAKVAGSMKSYTDTKAPVGVSYYAVTFNISQAVSNSLNQMHVTAASNDEGVSSNIISTEDAVDVVAAQSIELIVLDENKSLSNSHKELQLYYMILPTYATIDKVAWEITEGSNIAKIDANGKLTATGGKGTVKVRVNTIDGSNLSDEISVSCTVSGGAPTDVEKPETVTEKTLVGKRYFTIDGKPISNPVAGEVFVEWSIFSDGQITAKKMMKK